MVKEKNVSWLMRYDGCTLLTKNGPRPSDVGRGMLVCGSVAMELLEFVFGDLLTLSNSTIVTYAVCQKKIE